MLEIMLVLITTIAFQICEAIPGAKGPFIIVAALAWSGYIAWYRWRRPEALREWGFRRENLRPATLASFAVLAAGTLGLVIVAAGMHGWEAVTDLKPSFWLAALIYPAWGLLQQFLLNAMISRNLAQRLPPLVTVPLAATLFGLIHLPDLALAALCAVAALVWIPIYLHWRNLWPLGLCHGWLGAVAYYVLLRRDVLEQVSGNM